MILRLLILNIREIEKIVLDHDHNITTEEFNRLAAENFPARFKQANLATKADIDDFLKKGRF